jgi:hypothetical protein
MYVRLFIISFCSWVLFTLPKVLRTILKVLSGVKYDSFLSPGRRTRWKRESEWWFSGKRLSTPPPPPEELGEGLHLWLPIIQEPMKKERTNGDDSLTDDFSSEPEEEISSEEEMNLQRSHSDDGDTSDSEKNDSIGNNSDTSDDGSDNEEDQFSDDEFD